MRINRTLLVCLLENWPVLNNIISNLKNPDNSAFSPADLGGARSTNKGSSVEYALISKADNANRLLQLTSLADRIEQALSDGTLSPIEAGTIRALMQGVDLVQYQQNTGFEGDIYNAREIAITKLLQSI